MFFDMFWTAYVPFAVAILYPMADWLIRSLRKLGTHWWLVASNGHISRADAVSWRSRAG
jgi:hypothetical protein